MPKRTISTIILSVILTISVLSAFWIVFIKKPISYIKEEVEKKNGKDKSTPESDRILDLILDQKYDSLAFYAQSLKKENPQLAKKLERYIGKTTYISQEEEVQETQIDEIESDIIKGGKEKSNSDIEYADNNENNIHLKIEKDLNTLHTDGKGKILKFKIGRYNIFYTGEIVNEQANGKGKGVFDSGIIYDGEWENNKMNGEGSMKWPDESSYKGKFKNNFREGIGTFVYKNKEKYIGEWKNDKREGEGVLYDKKGNVKAKGEWKADLFIH